MVNCIFFFLILGGLYLINVEYPKEKCVNKQTSVGAADYFDNPKNSETDGESKEKKKLENVEDSDDGIDSKSI